MPINISRRLYSINMRFVCQPAKENPNLVRIFVIVENELSRLATYSMRAKPYVLRTLLFKVDAATNVSPSKYRRSPSMRCLVMPSMSMLFEVNGRSDACPVPMEGNILEWLLAAFG